MVSKKKYIITIVAVALLAVFLTLTIGNVFLVEIGQKVFLSKDEYIELKEMYEKYKKQEAIFKSYINTWVKKKMYRHRTQEQTDRLWLGWWMNTTS
jgi:hypothetical protein